MYRPLDRQGISEAKYSGEWGNVDGPAAAGGTTQHNRPIVGHAAAAIDALRHTIPDFVITDFEMAEMDGLTLATHMIRKNPDCKVIVVSGNPEAMGRHPHRHHFPVLQKPVSLSVMLEALQREMGSDGVVVAEQKK